MIAPTIEEQEQVHAQEVLVHHGRGEGATLGGCVIASLANGGQTCFVK